MDVTAIIDLIAKTISVLSKEAPAAFAAISDLKLFGTQLYNAIKGNPDISPEEQAALEARIDELSAELQQPLPPE